MTVGADHGISGSCGLVLYTVEHSCVVVGYEVGHNHTDNFGCLTAQTLCKWVRAVVELLGQFLDFLLHVFAYFRAVAQCPAHGCYAYAQFAGKVFK